MNTRKMTIGAKIMLSEGITIAFLVILGVYAVISMSSLEQKLDQNINRETRKIELTGNLNSAVSILQDSQRGIVMGSMTNDAKLMETSQLKLAEAREQMTDSLRDLEPLLVTSGGRQSFASLRSAADEWIRLLPTFEAHLKGQRFDEVTRMQNEQFRPLLEKMTRDSATLKSLVHDLMTASAAEASSQVNFARVFTLILCVISGLMAGLGLWVMRSSNKELRRIAAEIAEGSRQVASAAHQVSGSSQALAQGSSEQAATLEETSASTEEINSMTQKNAENARNAANETEKADQLLKETDQKLTQMIGSMKEINTSSEKISKIIRVIDEIAFQTNILALNAAVEAARAGEAGMGFAVVADEVRNLAQRCAQAAKDTSDLIEESIIRSNEGKVKLDEVAGCVSRVVDNASRIKVLANEVNLGSQEQARGIEQISRAVAQMQQVTQSTAASAEEGASAGEEMSAQAQSLQDAVERLRDVVGTGEEEARRSNRVPENAKHSRQSTPAGAALAEMARRSPATGAARPQSPHKPFPMDDDFRDF